jgi:autophagy-related protein 16-1
MNEIYQLLLERNARETAPFVSIHQANATLLNQVDSLQQKCQLVERQVARLTEQLQENTTSNKGGSSAVTTAALKNERRLREKLEKLQEELNAKTRIESEERAAALQTTKELSLVKDLNTAQEYTIRNLRQENEQLERAVEHLTNEMNSAKSDTNLAEQQYDGLKRSIRTLQEENDEYKKENRMLEARLMESKGKTVEEMNILTDMVDALKQEVDMLRAFKAQEEKRSKSWFRGSTGNTFTDQPPAKEEPGASRKWGSLGVVLPSAPKHVIQAHSMEGMSLRYDAAGSDLLATASSDSTVKVWDVNTATVRATLRGTSGHALTACDLHGSLAVGGSSDKTCRVWNIHTERMVSSAILE